jgi:hypothetical protein
MLRPYVFLVRVAAFISRVLPFGVLVFNLARSFHHLENRCRWADPVLKLGVLLALCLPVCAAVLFLHRGLAEAMEQVSAEQGKHLGSLLEP